MPREPQVGVKGNRRICKRDITRCTFSNALYQCDHTWQYAAQALPDEVGHDINVIEVAKIRHEQHRAKATDQRAEEYRDKQGQAAPLATDHGRSVVKEYQQSHGENLRAQQTQYARRFVQLVFAIV